MANKQQNTVTTSTPRRNPKRVCSREIPWKINGEDSDSENDSVDSFVIFIKPPENDDVYTPPPMTVLDACKLRSAQGILNEEKGFTPRSRRDSPQKYDPDHDVFVHSGMKLKYDSVHLKNRIKHFMKSSDVPAYKRAVRSLLKKKPVVKKPRPYKRREKRIPQEPEPEVIDVGGNPHYGRSSPGAIKAMLYARQILQRIQAKRKYLSVCNQNTLNCADTPRGNELPHALGAPEQNPTGLAMQACSSTREKSQSSCNGVNQSKILKGVVAFVDVISFEDEDMSGVVGKELEKLGATVVLTFTKKDPVSVVLFNNGHVSTYKKAKKRGIPLVSVLWIEECRRTGVQASTSMFLSSNTEQYECPKFVKEIKKRKFLYVGGRTVPRKTRKRVRNIEAPTATKPKLETTPELPSKVDPGPAWIEKYKKRNDGLRILVDLTGVNEEQFKEMMVEPDDSEKYEFSPLPMRLLYRLAKDLRNSRDTSSTSGNESTPSICTSECRPDDSESDSISILASPLKDITFESTEDDLQKSHEGNNENCLKESPKSTPKRRYSERIRNVKRKLTY